MNRQSRLFHESRKRSRRERHRWIPSIITIAFTLINLGIAGATLYFNFFWVSNRLEAQLVRELFGGFDADSVTVKLAVINAGNRQALLNEMALVRVQASKGSYGPVRDPNMQNVNPQLPIVIEPGKVAILTLTLRSIPRNWFSNSDECDSSTIVVLNANCFSLGISWAAVNSEGESFNNHTAIAHLTLAEKNTRSFIGLPIVINLFSNPWDQNESNSWFSRFFGRLTRRSRQKVPPLKRRAQKSRKHGGFSTSPEKRSGE